MPYIHECLAEPRKSLGSFVRFSFSPLVQRLLLQPVIRHVDAGPNHTSGKPLAYWRNLSKVFANPGRPPVKCGSYHHQWRSLIRPIFRDEEQHQLLLRTSKRRWTNGCLALTTVRVTWREMISRLMEHEEATIENCRKPQASICRAGTRRFRCDARCRHCRQRKASNTSSCARRNAEVPA
jgi:hypothetical protein